ncbi:MAG: hypothetical protein PHV82_16340, partial [Victivallaceae bacterium]|nr:hypothetical protein [Victivallaceae bacterium]
MINVFKAMFGGLLGMSLLAAGATTAGEKPGRPERYEVYEEKLTEDIPLSPCSPNEKVSWLWTGTEADKKMDGYNAIFEMAQKNGFNMISFNSSPIASIIQGDKENISNAIFNALDEFLSVAKKYNFRVMINFGFHLGRRGASAENKGIANLLDKKYNERLFRLLDGIAERKKKYGNDIIIFWDEIWCNEIFYSRKNCLSPFKTFCQKEYGEEYHGTEMPLKVEPMNKWWRRYIVFKNCIYENFCERLLDYAHKKNLRVINRPYPSFQSASGWKWGMDSYRLSKLADYNQTWFWRVFEGDYYENSLMGMYKNPEPISMALYLKGYPVQYFTYARLRDDPWVKVKIPEMFKQAKIWQGAERKADVCILNYPVALIGLFAEKSPQAYKDNDELFERLSRYFGTDRTDVRNSRFYRNYQVLIIPQYSACSIPEYAYKGLLDFAKNGGTIIISDAEVGIGKRDLTNPRDMRSEITGTRPVWQGKANGQIKFSEASLPVKNIRIKALEIGRAKALAAYNGKPVITEYRLGKGYVVYLGFNIAELIRQDNKWLEVLKDIVLRYCRPGVLADGKINVESVIKKDNRVLISLYPMAAISRADASKAKPTDQMGDLPLANKQLDSVPGNISIAPDTLGLRGNLFQIFSVTRCKIIRNKDNKGVWTLDELKKGRLFVIDGQVGYEHLIVESPGAAHTEQSILQKVADVDKAIREKIAEAKKHPRGLNKNPFLIKSISSDIPYTAQGVWTEKNNYRLPFYIENTLDFPRKAEPVIIKWKDLIKGAKLLTHKNSISLYRINGGQQEPIPCQA